MEITPSPDPTKDDGSKMASPRRHCGAPSAFPRRFYRIREILSEDRDIVSQGNDLRFFLPQSYVFGKFGGVGI
jgi:hypothetical protein